MRYYEAYRYVSNSTLTRFENFLNAQTERDLTATFNFGNLIDAMITETDKVNGNQLQLETFSGKGGTNGLITSKGDLIEFDDETMKKAGLMKLASDSDSTMKLLLETMKTQHAVYREKFKIEYMGDTIYLPMRCKYDFVKMNKRGADLKTTACTSQKSFVESLFHFNYDRQGALYMDLGGLEEMIYVGISKKPNPLTRRHDIYKFVIRKGDETYLSGKQKYSKLAYKYYWMIHNINPELLTINV